MIDRSCSQEQNYTSFDEENPQSESTWRESKGVAGAGELEKSNTINTELSQSTCCRHQKVFVVIAFALAGFTAGFGMSLWEPEDEQIKTTVLQWIGLLGTLFVRALKALVLPLVFVNVWLAVMDIASDGLAGRITQTVVSFFALTTVMASIAGMLPFLLMRHQIEQLGGSDGTEEYDGSVSQIIYDGIFVRLVPDNVVGAWVDGNYAAVVVMAVCFGVALIAVLGKRQCDPVDCTMVQLLRDTNDMVQILTSWVLKITPLAVFSLNVKAVGSQDDIMGTMSSVGWLIFAFGFAVMIHFSVGLIGLYVITTKSNPFNYMCHLIPAISTAFATSSSAAALPVNLECVRNSGKVPESINRFVLALGLTMNMDGTALYASCGSLWLAYVNGMEPSIGQILLLIILSSVGSVGAAPVPYGPLMVVLNTFATVFGVSSTTQGQEFLFALDWLLDGTGSALNVAGNAFVASFVASRCLDIDTEAENNRDIRAVASALSLSEKWIE